MIESVAGAPEFLALAAWRETTGRTFEVVSRRRLDTRQVVPFFEQRGSLWVGALERVRSSRRLRGEDAVGLEPIGFDFAGVDETGDVLEYGRTMFSSRARLRVRDDELAIPLPSLSRSIGYATELSLPLLLPIEPPERATIEVGWDGGEHRIVFDTLERMRARVAAERSAEDLALMLAALAPPRRLELRDDPNARALLDRAEVWDAAALARAVRARTAAEGFEREGALAAERLRFLSLHRVREESGWFEIVTPRSGRSLAVVPYVVHQNEPWFLLWVELRVATLERRFRQPIFDLPMHPRYVNATARYLATGERADAARILRENLGEGLSVRSVLALGCNEPAPSFSSELRERVACEIDAASLGALPDDVVMVRGDELASAARDGVIRDPVVVSALLALGLDPFEEIRRGSAPARRVFIDRMTEGSIVQRRLRSYSSIEAEQLDAPSYARLMLLLQHEYGVRIAYPKTETDRSFFKAAFRVFMAAPRGDEDRALQGLHWSHDAFHFALGNFTLPAEANLAEWYLSDRPLPEPLPPEGPRFDAYARALKAAEDEATFFSFWTLYEEKPSLARHVGKLTFHEALRALGVTTREESRAIFDDVTSRALIPSRVTEHEAHRTRDDVRALFEYMRGFRDYHLEDIRAAFRHASRDVYRGFFLRFGIYESDADRYVASVRSFPARLAGQPPGLNPLLAAAADVRVSIALRVFDAVKSLKLQRAATTDRARRRAALDAAEARLSELASTAERLAEARASIGDAELTACNERSLARLVALEGEVERVRTGIWDDAASNGVLSAATIDEERVRELPR